jgi:hypothetical protein
MGSHSQIYAGREFDFTKDITSLRNRLHTGHASGRIADLVNKDDIDKAVESFTVKLFERALRDHGKTILCEKTPSNALVMADLCECMPDAYCILVLPDPRAIVGSMKEVARKYFAEGLRPPPFCASVAASIDDINETWEKGLAAVQKYERVQTIFYEDLVENPERVVRDICQFVGLDYQDDMVQPAPLEDRQNHVSDQFWYTKEELEKPISDDSLKRYKQILSPREITLVERFVISHPLTERYGIGARSPSALDHCAMLWNKFKALKIMQKIRAKFRC